MEIMSDRERKLRMLIGGEALKPMSDLLASLARNENLQGYSDEEILAQIKDTIGMLLDRAKENDSLAAYRKSEKTE
ncbi:MAG: hypothetical protein COU63_02910 [Candidatus Pacebacteria bacterium CG10_big_fil_rev_8_21_14_0_10_36_11]|nr:hypothetical protein [Candidatus Pacearchaeota archaeon]OIP74380.1 MAG: hypothetical protein AUK08_01170 [Candidatus Pacebacteria bacterium CG2_30_36_39]PIR64943.1 MAG: hypothetical protein COU63_02910 [Candidatus Pacebacteria bacterium CG10_big_fil_rev_8_21_14_0_10_36_11]PJC43033.1 MAG: hypothetical protein CO040_01290 [Candidatus Pacebacteria bacterium CG_4_9_14_0_2_um_filter_36_8]